MTNQGFYFEVEQHEEITPQYVNRRKRKWQRLVVAHKYFNALILKHLSIDCFESVL